MKYVLLLILFPAILFAQDNEVLTQETATDRAMNSTADQGGYWDNGFAMRWASFGAFYRTRLYYRFALNREKNSFWFANSALELGLEQAVGSSSQTYAYMYWQPAAPFSMVAKIGYSKDIVKFAQLNGPFDNYTHALPPATGKNPLTRKPVRAENVDTFEFVFSPTWYFGGPLGNGTIALIYTPNMNYIHNFGMSNNQYYFHNKEAIILKAQDIFWSHDIKLGYIIKGTGINVALTALVDHVQSVEGVFRSALFGSFSYERAVKKYPSLIPYFKAQVGTWLVDRDQVFQGDFVFQIDTGLKFKFN